MSASCKNADAVKQLLRTADPKDFIESLTDMWEVWIMSELTDNTPASLRADRLMSYKAMCELLRNISRDGC